MERKFVIPPPKDQTTTPQQWEENYKANQYDDVLNITQDPGICAAFVRGLPTTTKSVLIAGCGSKTNLQRYVVEQCLGVDCIFCTDCSKEALDLAQAEFSHSKIKYQEENTTALSFSPNTFDAILVCNSILDHDDLTNRQMVLECYRVLRPGGVVIGLFPTLFCPFEISLLGEQYLHQDYRRSREEQISFKNSTFFEKKQRMYQIFYTPIRLNQVFKEACFLRERMEVCFFDSQLMIQESARCYGLPRDSGLCIWQLLVIYRK